jgi:hypothetical protein
MAHVARLRGFKAALTTRINVATAQYDAVHVTGFQSKAMELGALLNLREPASLPPPPRSALPPKRREKENFYLPPFPPYKSCGSGKERDTRLWRRKRDRTK